MSDHRMPPVFLNGLGKSGNNYMLQLLRQLGYEVLERGLGAHLLEGRFGLAKRVARFPIWGPAVPVGIENNQTVSLRFLRDRLKQLVPGLVIPGHTPYSSILLNEVVRLGGRVIYVKRRPSDLAVSYMNWIRKETGAFQAPIFRNLSEEEALRVIVSGYHDKRYCLEGLAAKLDRVQGWVLSPKVHTVAYEDLVSYAGSNPDRARQAVRNLNQFLGGADVDLDTALSAAYGQSKTFFRGQAGASQEAFDADLWHVFNTEMGPERLAFWESERC